MTAGQSSLRAKNRPRPDIPIFPYTTKARLKQDPLMFFIDLSLKTMLKDDFCYTLALRDILMQVEEKK